MKYTGTAIPAKRNAATPQAVACPLPCLLACAKTPAEIAAARATPSRKAGGLAVTAARYGSWRLEREERIGNCARRAPGYGAACGRQPSPSRLRVGSLRRHEQRCQRERDHASESLHQLPVVDFERTSVGRLDLEV